MTKQDLENKLNKIFDILVYSRQLFYDSYGMFVTKTNVKHLVISVDKFLERTRDSFWKLAIIELSKLFGENNSNDHYSILLLIKTLRKKHFNAEWSSLITPEELKKIEATFKVQDFKARVNKLTELRNQHYAHTDKIPKNNVYDLKLSFEDCFFLVDKAEIFTKDLYLKILGKVVDFPQYEGEDMENFLDKHIELLEIAGLYNINKSRNK